MTAAARTARFLTAVSASGIIVHLEELIGAESLSQRYNFVCALASHVSTLSCIVHDDACHLGLMAKSQKGSSSLTRRLADEVRFIVDAFHSTAHVGEWCRDNCLPDLPQNEALLRNFPTSIAESVNHNLSPLGHTFHHMGPYVAKLTAMEVADVHNLKVLRCLEDKCASSARKAARRSAADPAAGAS